MTDTGLALLRKRVVRFFTPLGVFHLFLLCSWGLSVAFFFVIYRSVTVAAAIGSAMFLASLLGAFLLDGVET